MQTAPSPLMLFLSAASFGKRLARMSCRLSLFLFAWGGAISSWAAAPSIYNLPPFVTVDSGQSLTLTPAVAGTTPITYQWKKNGVDISGATTASFWKSPVATADAGDYTLVATNASGSTTSSVVTVQVNAPQPPMLYPTSTAVSCDYGTTLSLSMTVAGTTPMTFQWKKNGVDIPNATSSNYSKNLVTGNDAGVYTLVATNSAGSATSSGVTVTVADPVAPEIYELPLNRTAERGGSFSLSATVSGSQPMTFQWQKDSVDIPNATDRYYSKSDVADGDAGAYRLVATNAAGSTTSADIPVSVIAPQPPSAPAITFYSTPSATAYGDSISIYASVTGTQPMTFQWYRDGTALPGRTSSSLYLSPAKVSDSGSYTLRATNSVGTTTSIAVPVTVSAPVGPTVSPLNASVNLSYGSSLNLSVNASGSPSLRYQWTKDGNFIPGASSSYYSKGSVTTADAGRYAVIVANDWGTVTSSAAVVTVAQPVAPTIQLNGAATIDVAYGASFSISPTVSGTSPMTYEWRRNGVTLFDATGSSIGRSSVTGADAGTYTLVVTNAWGTTTSTGTVVTVGAAVAPQITGVPATLNVSSGSSFSLNASIAGTAPIVYQWNKNGVPIPGATSTSYSKGLLSVSDSGMYTLTAVNVAGSTTSSACTLTVSAPIAPVISGMPSSATINYGASVSLSPNVTGTSPMTLQWSKNGNAIPGANSSSFYLYSATPSDNGTYTLTATNGAGSTTSAGYQLTVLPGQPPVVHNLPSTITINQGSSFAIYPFVQGTGPMNFQWRRDGVAIVGAINSSFSKSSALPADSGAYSLVVTNAWGAVTTRDISVTVTPAVAPAVLDVPAARTANYGDSITLSPAVVGTGPLSYQWSKDGNPIPGANSRTLGFSPATPAVNGIYTLTVSNAVGSVTSPGITLIVNPAVPPAIFNLPTDLNLSYGSTSLSLGAMVVGSWPMSYVWRKDGVPLGSSNTSFSKYGSITPADSGVYTLTASNVAGTATSTVNVTVAAAAAPSISGLPATLSVVYGGSINLNASVSGSPSIRYQWRKNGADIPGANNSYFNVGAATPSDSGQYSLVATNVAGTATSASVAVTVQAVVPVSFLEQPSSIAVQPGLTANFSVQTAGTSPISYQWYRNGSAIIGSTSNALVLSGVQSASAGDYTVVARNAGGEVTSNVATLTMETPVGVLSVAGGSWHSAILKADGTLWMVGGNLYGQLGNGSFRGRLNPTQVATGVTSVATGNDFTIFLKNDGTLWGMGNNAQGQLGDGTTQTRALPIQIATNVVAVAAGWAHTLFVKNDGSLWGMGNNTSGQLGDGAATNRLSPIAIATAGVRAVAAGGNSSYYVTDAGTLWAIGANGNGQLGVGDATDRLVPVSVTTGVVSVSASGGHVLWVKADGSLWAAGGNGYGQLGDGTTTPRSSAVQVATGVESAAAGSSFSAYVKSDGSLWTVGINSSGQLGDGSWSSRTTPASIASDVAFAIASPTNLFVISTTGALYATGENYSGALGDGTTSSRNTLTLLSAAPSSLAPRPLPAEQAVASGGVVRLSVFGAGGASYQWYRNGVAISGATGRTLTLGGVQSADAGDYSVLVTLANSSVVTLHSWVGVRSSRTAHGDLDRDGAPDLVLENAVTGQRLIWRMRNGGIVGSVSLPTLSAGWHFAGTGDFNRDAVADIVLQNTQTGERVIWLMNGGTITGSAGLPTLPLVWQIACIGDVDGDGSADVVLQNTDTGDRLVWKMNGVAIATSLGLPTLAPEWQICAVIDIDSDGQNDLVLQNVRTGERKVWILALQSGQLSINRTIPLPTFYAGWRFAGGGFYTTDGKPNLLLQNSLTGDRILWSMGSDGAILGSTALPTLPADWSFAGAATNRAPISGPHDLSGDGGSDILVTNTATGDRVMWVMQNGAIAGSIGLPTLPAEWRFAGIGDFNADGLNDIVVENTNTGDRVLWFMNNGTIGGGAGLPALAPAWRFAAVVDVNLDGQPDIVLQNTSTGERAIWVMDRAKVDSTIALPTLPTSWNIAAAGKFTADGRANLVLENTSTGDRLFWSLNPDGSIAQSTGLPTLPVSWRFAGSGDFNTDGKPDLILENMSTGDRVIWVMDRTTIASSLGLPTLPASWTLRD
ncbi:MAG: immunoglobulin domain-containing protein [Opitutae bacterium]|nr:immunoglobulin domain-containing protein [Opitutae bacterium]